MDVAAHEPIYTPAIDVEDLTHRLGAEFSSGQKFGWVAEVHDKLAGYLTCSVQEEEPIFVERRYVYVADLNVAPS